MALPAGQGEGSVVVGATGSVDLGTGVQQELGRLIVTLPVCVCVVCGVWCVCVCVCVCVVCGVCVCECSAVCV